uniref:AB hydrolase-1 domain-containing protein n=1 Tax=Bionectria ochroleuca TaxID=29856 RepID=A0A8H7NQ69_BIOOC
MKKLTASLILLTGLACKADSLSNRGMVYGFDDLTPSANLTWTPCFDDFTCSKLEVPLDYSNPGLGKTSVAFMKLAGKNATTQSPSIVLIPGGPGGSGIDILLTSRSVVGQMFGEQYNVVSFDPRGVNNSGLNFDCFRGNAEARMAFNRLHATGATNISSESLQEQYYSASIYGEWCNEAAEATLANQPELNAKLWSYGMSYGTVIGATFAAMFPDRVGRMILDGVLDAEQYYDNNWRDVTDQMDETIGKFSSLCHSAGPERCSFWGPSPANITARLDRIILDLQSHPVAVSRAQRQGLPTMVTYSDLKDFIFTNIYTPLSGFPAIADVLHQLENGNATALADLSDGLGITLDAGFVIRCVDSYRRNKLATIEEFKSYVEYMVSTSKYTGDIFPIVAENIVCRSLRPQLPESMDIQSTHNSLLTSLRILSPMGKVHQA